VIDEIMPQRLAVNDSNKNDETEAQPDKFVALSRDGRRRARCDYRMTGFVSFRHRTARTMQGIGDRGKGNSRLVDSLPQAKHVQQQGRTCLGAIQTSDL